MMKLRGWLMAIVLLGSLTAMAQKVKTVQGEATYYAAPRESLADAQRAALEQAKIKAVGDEFGYIISQTNLTEMDNEREQYLFLGSSDVKGEWLETIGEPAYTKDWMDDVLVVTCRVKGKAREIVSSKIDFQARVLRNGTDDRSEADVFMSGNDLYLSFLSPVSGFVAVYLVDDAHHVQCLLPYQNQREGIYAVSGNQRYVFFSQKDAPKDPVDEYVLTSEQPVEHNQVYVVFSPNQFVKAVDKNSGRTVQMEGVSGLPRELGYKEFHEWLARCRRQDKDMCLKKILITVKQ